MYPTQMRRHKILRILLILFIVNQVVNLAFGAPVAAREKLEGCINAGGTEDGAAVLQKRVDVEEGSTNMAVQTSSDRTEANRLRQEMGQRGMDLRPRRIPPSLAPGDDTVRVTPPTRPTPPPPEPPRRPLRPLIPFRPYSILTTNPRLPIRPFSPRPHSPLRPNNVDGPTRLARPARPARPYFPLPLYRPYHPLTLPHTSPPPLPEGGLRPAPSSITTNNLNPSTTGYQLTPQQNSGPDLNAHPPLNQEQTPPNQKPNSLPNSEPHSLPNLEQRPPNPGPHPSTSGETPIDDVLGVLKKGKIKRTFPARVQ